MGVAVDVGIDDVRDVAIPPAQLALLAIEDRLDRFDFLRPRVAGPLEPVAVLVARRRFVVDLPEQHAFVRPVGADDLLDVRLELLEVVRIDVARLGRLGPAAVVVARQPARSACPGRSPRAGGSRQRRRSPAGCRAWRRCVRNVLEVGHQDLLLLEEVDVVQVDPQRRDAEVLARRGEFLVDDVRPEVVPELDLVHGVGRGVVGADQPVGRRLGIGFVDLVAGAICPSEAASNAVTTMSADALFTIDRRLSIWLSNT